MPRTRDLSSFVGTRYFWADAACADGALPLGTMGYEQELFVDVDPAGSLLTLDTRVPKKGCSELSVWRVWRGSEGRVRFQTAPAVVTPAGQDCTVQEAHWLLGRIALAGDVLELTLERSAYCRGYDAHFFYKRVAPRAWSEEELLRRFVARFNLRDSTALVDLFAEDGMLLEPFSRSLDGTATQHAGTEALRRYFTDAFAATDWSALRMLSSERDDGRTGWIVEWEYMDSELAQPFVGRSLFVFAGDHIFLLELQPISVVVPAAHD